MRQHYNFSKIKCDASFQPRDTLWVLIVTLKPCNDPKFVSFVSAVLFLHAAFTNFASYLLREGEDVSVLSLSTAA
jgi:hypothetical protein